MILNLMLLSLDRRLHEYIYYILYNYIPVIWNLQIKHLTSRVKGKGEGYMKYDWNILQDLVNNGEYRSI